MVNVVISFPAKNEEKNLDKVLQSIINQTHKPYKVVIANDGSTDNTRKILEKYDIVDIHDRPTQLGTVVGKREMANVWNSSLIPVIEMNKSVKIDYLIFLGADIVLPPNYISQLLNKFENNSNLKIASGIMTGKHAYKSTGFMIPGPGRIIDFDYWLSLGGKYIVNEGWEAYPIYRANLDGFETKVFDDIPYHPLRPTGGRTDYFAYGQAMKALGYSKLFGIGRILKQPFLQSRTIISSWHMFRGFFFGKTEYYEEELRNYVKKSQIERLKSIFKIF